LPSIGSWTRLFLFSSQFSEGRMSAVADRHTRRDIRRAMGVQALDLVSKQARGLFLVGDELQRVSQRTDHALAILERGFWGRLKWLLRGR
jgi:hypothetical protein